jgi:hypothetical protein
MRFFIIILFTKKILLGSICAIFYCHSWQRALVEHIPQPKVVNVFFLDNGNRTAVKSSDCFELSQFFFDHPAQATRAMLNEIGPFTSLEPSVRGLFEIPSCRR